MADMMGDLLGKLSRKTGREWTVLDLLRLAQKLPDLQKGGDVNSLFTELGDMGLELPDETREKVKEQLADGGFSQQQADQMLDNLSDKKVEEVSGKWRKKPDSRKKTSKKRKS